MLLLANMILSTIMFCDDNRDYDVIVRESGVVGANLTLWFFGFLSIGMPVLQAGVWLHGSMLLAWGLIIVPAILWGLIFLLSASDD